MSTIDGQSAPGGSPSSEPANLKLEALVIPVVSSDVMEPFTSLWTMFDSAFKTLRMSIAKVPPPLQPMQGQMARL